MTMTCPTPSSLSTPTAEEEVPKEPGTEPVLSDCESVIEDTSPDELASNSPVEFPELPRLTRILLLLVGGVLFLIGFIGLLLPVFPQTVPLAVGTALITLGSRTAHRVVHRALTRWPRLQKLVARTQERLHRWVAPRD